MSDGKMIDFDAKGKSGHGYLVAAEGQAKAGLIVIQEWWGLNDHIKDIADRFAAQGYTSLAPDLYDGKTTKSSEEAGKFMQSLDRERAMDILTGAVAHLQSLGLNSLGVTGFCMGGTFALLLPCHKKAIKAAAPFYGDVPPDE